MSLHHYRQSFGAVLLAAITLASSDFHLRAHGFEGDRFFPPTIQTDDPFASDEFNINASTFNNPAASDGSSSKTREIDVSSGLVKEIFPKFALGISGTYLNLNPQGGQGPAQDGFANISVSAKYQLWENGPHEWILSLGGEVDLGGTGSKGLGVDSFSTWTPSLYFGKGFGDLPAGLKYLRPLALTGVIGVSLPGESANPDGAFNSDALQWGFALEYNLSYLEQHVEDIDLPKPLRDMIPLVEFANSTPFDRAGSPTTGTIDPGVLWEQRDYQLGVEAVIPIDRHTGPNVGAVVSVQIYIDDIFPKFFGRPIFLNHDTDNIGER